MTHTPPRTSGLWTLLHIAIILASAAIVLYPPILRLGAFIVPCCLVLMPVYFVLLVRRMKADRTGNVPMSALHAQVKSGWRLPSSALEWAAAVALVLSTIYMARGLA